MTTTPDPKTVREIAQQAMVEMAFRYDAVGSVLDARGLDRQLYGDVVVAAIDAATVAVSWAAEQPQAERDDSFAMVAEGMPAGPPRAVAEYWRDYAQAVSNDGRFTDWAQIAQVATWILAAMDTEQDERDGDVRALAAFFASDRLGPAMAELEARFADRIAALDARDAKGG